MASREIRTELRPEGGPAPTIHAAANKADKGEAVVIDKNSK